jgi:putative FmdB family regulatory protein
MPIFEYICKECHHQFEALVYGKEKAECPKCHTKKLAPQLSVFAVSAKVHRRRRRTPGHADRAAIREGRGHARCAT